MWVISAKIIKINYVRKKNISRLSARYRTSSTEPMTFWYDRGLYMVE